MGARARIVFSAAAVAGLVTIGTATATAQDSGAGGDATTTTPATEQPPAAVERDSGERDAGGEPGPGADRRPTTTAVSLKGLRKGRLTAGRRVKVAGTLRPFEPGQKVEVVVLRGKKTIERKKVTVKPKRKQGSNLGKFTYSRKLVQSGRYSVRAMYRKTEDLGRSKDASRRFRIRFPSLREGNSSDAAKLLNGLLAKLGYVNDRGKNYNAATARAVLAYRKVNNMARKTKATSRIFKRLASGKGGYKLKHPGAGKHVETDLSRQVMVLAKGNKVDEIYHVSTGAPATPTIPGSWRFYRKEPGTNNVGMVHSVYYNRGYATHGYPSVPNYPASHGCLRNPIPDAKHIYNWIDIGDPIFIYR